MGNFTCNLTQATFGTCIDYRNNGNAAETQEEKLR
jgi:hypothetical protein